MIDAILKEVQGNYIKFFEPKVNYILSIVITKVKPNIDILTVLVKIFKTWEVLELFDQKLINEVAEHTGIRQMVSVWFRNEYLNEYRTHRITKNSPIDQIEGHESGWERGRNG